jgi:glycosyltransferase involved in cell wall biosynthesis
MPLVSCVLPVFNGALYLEEAIHSVLGQTFRDFELIIIDDGSTDTTAEIIAQAAKIDHRVISLRQANAGIVSALNNGLRCATGKYVARMDADDISLPQRFAFQVSYLDSHPDCVLVGGLAEGFSSGGSEGVSSGGRHQQTDLKCFPPKIAVSLHPLIMVRREAIEQLGGYRNLFPHAEDYDLFLRLAALGSIENPDKVVLRYRRHADAISLRHLDTQERNAALAEACAIRETELKQALAADADVEAIALKVWPRWLFEPYVAFRIWRRIFNLTQKPAAKNNISVLNLALSLEPAALLSSRYFGLRVRILTSLCGSLTRKVCDYLPYRTSAHELT